MEMCSINKIVNKKNYSVAYDSRLKEALSLVYCVSYYDKDDKVVVRNIGITRDKDNALKRPMRHITDTQDKSCKWLERHTDIIDHISITILEVVNETKYHSDKALKTELQRLEGAYNVDSCFIKKIPVLNKFTHNGFELNGFYGLYELGLA